jgi:hypothetical protein
MRIAPKIMILLAAWVPAAVVHAAAPTPYLQLGGGGATVVRWFSAPNEAGRVDAALVGQPLVPAGESPAGPRHAVALSGLLPDTTYAYRVISSADTSATLTFRTLPANRSRPFSFAVYGDDRSQPDRHRAVLERIAQSERPLLVVNTGDLVASGGDSLRWHTEFFDPGAVLFGSVPFLATPGNHDLDRNRQPRALARWWFDDLTLPPNGTGAGKGRWWSLRAGGCLLIGLDSIEPSAPGQTQWLASILAAADPRDFVIVFFHHPPWSAGGHGSDPVVRKAWGRLLDDRRVDVVFNGHNHFYQRSYPLRAGQVVTRRPGSYTAGRGTVYCVTGGGGAPLYSPQSAPFVAAQFEDYHYVRVDYAPGRLVCTAVRHDGRECDRFTIEKPSAR